MKKLVLFSFVICATLLSRAQVLVSVVSTAGGLSAAVGANFDTVTNLTVSGNINAKDFVALFNMPMLSVLDLSAATIDGYVGTDGPLGADKGGNPNQYSPNAVPNSSFYQGRASKTSLTSVILPTSLTSIGESAFYGCTGLTSVTFSNVLTSINYLAFYNCSSLSDLSIPASLTALNITAFQGCTGLSTISVAANNPNYSSANDVLFNKAQTLLLKCAALKAGIYAIPATVTTLNEGAFMDCKNLTSISIPPSVTSIGVNVLKNCTALTSIYASPTTPISLSAQSTYFTGINMSTCILYVPINSYSAYRGASQWLSFTNIIESNLIPYLSVSSTALNVAAAANSTNTFDIQSNVNWSATSNQSWLLVCSNPGSNNATITLTAEANPTIFARIATVTIQGIGLASKTITVTQTAGVPGLSVSTNTLQVEASASSSAQFTVNSTVNWEISSNQSWLQANILTGSGNALVTVYASENTLLQSRQATVTVSANGLPSQTIIVTQAEWKPILIVSKNTLIVASTNNSTDAFVIASNISWNVSSDKSWLKVSQATGSNNQNMSVTADANPSINSRNATLTVSGTNVASKLITVTQQGKSPFLYVPTEIIYISAAEDLKYNVELISTTTWNVQSDQPWLSVNKTSGYDDGTIPIEAAVNTSGSSRTATLTFIGAGVPTKYVTIKQASSALIYKTVNIIAGGLSAALTETEPNTVTDLTVSGTFDDRDFSYMRDSMPELQHLDLSASTVAAGSDLANTIPSNNTNSLWKNFLFSVVFPNNLTVIGMNAFYNCNTLKSVQFPSTLITIGGYSFYGSIGGAFYKCNNLSSVVLPPNLKNIGVNAFRDCLSLTSITIPTSVTSIGQYAFFGCLKLQIFSDNPNWTSPYSFPNVPSNWKQTTDVIFPNGGYLDHETFSNCINLNSIFLPASLDTVPVYTFYNCSASITVDPNNPKHSSDNGVLYNKNKSQIYFCPITKTGSFTIPSSVTKIRKNAFVNCAGLTSITIPEGVTSIGTDAFIGCSGLTTLRIPSSVSTIGYAAFKACSGLTSIYANSVVPPTLDNEPENYGFNPSSVFRNVNKSTCTLYVPAGSVDAYKEIPQWQDFLNIVADVSTKTIHNPLQSIHLLYQSGTNSFVINGLKENAAFMLVNLNGKVLQSKQVSENETVSLNSHPKGIYIVKISTTEGTCIQKIINI